MDHGSGASEVELLGFYPPFAGSDDGPERPAEPGSARLPPPMFPPGPWDPQGRRGAATAPSRGDESIPDDAFILPDAPSPQPSQEAGLRERGEEEPEPALLTQAAEEPTGLDPSAHEAESPVPTAEAAADDPEGALGPDVFPEDAFIHPDAPVLRVRRTEEAENLEDLVLGAAHHGFEDVVVTGIGDDPHLEEEVVLVEDAADGDPHVADLVRAVDRLARALRARGEAGLRATPDMTRFEATLRAYCVGYLAGRREELG